MVKSYVALGAIALFVVGAGCSKPAEKKSAEQASATRTPSPSTPSLTHEDLDPSRSSSTTLASKVFQQLTLEKNTRPKVALPAERVVEAFREKGIESEPLKQGLGGPIKAGYCALGRTKKGVGFTLCEYPTAELAQEGKGVSEQRYRGALGRKLFLNKETLLVVRAGESEETAAEAKEMASIFGRLR